MEGNATHWLGIKKLTAPDHVSVAARHNLREIATENAYFMKKHSYRKNVILAGPTTSADVTQLAKDTLQRAEVTKQRKNGVRAIEVVVSLPLSTKIDVDAFFRDVLEWITYAFGVPVLSAVVHLDEDEPHCHFLLLPLRENRLCGSELVGARWNLVARHRDFVDTLGKKYELQFPIKRDRLSLALRNDLASKIVNALRERPEFLSDFGVRQALHRVLIKNPQTIATAVGIPVPNSNIAHNRFIEIMTQACPVAHT